MIRGGGIGIFNFGGGVDIWGSPRGGFRAEMRSYAPFVKVTPAVGFRLGFVVRPS
jgi:hypothetical protein